MSRRPIANVRVITMPQLGEGAVRIEVECSGSTTGLTSVPGPLELPTPALITAACFAHEEKCGECDASEAHAQGQVGLREWTEEAWARATAESVRRHFHGRRN